MSDMIIREVCVNDAPAIAVVRNETWYSAYRGIVADDYLDEMSLKDARARFAAGIASPDESFFMVVKDGNLIGFSACGKAREGEGYRRARYR